MSNASGGLVRRTLGILAFAVEAVVQFLSCTLACSAGSVVLTMRSASAESSLPRQSSIPHQLVSKTNDADLFLGFESLDFFDDLTRSHLRSLSHDDNPSNNVCTILHRIGLNGGKPPDLGSIAVYATNPDPSRDFAESANCKQATLQTSSRNDSGFGPGLVIPDLWQQEAVRALQQGKDVVVQAPTGSGKTYIFELLYPNLKTQAVFTVPTRALANDKLSEWRARGWDVGISTGDVALNLDAKVVVATLETQRGRFLRGEGPGLLVMDEFQMLGDPMRGVHYELAVALAPKATQLLFLSGSVANPHDVVAWLQRIGRDAVLIEHKTRPVPLEETDLGNLPDSQFVQSRSPSSPRRVFDRTGGSFWPRMIGRAMRADLAPVLVFAPRRAAAEQIAQAIASALPVRDPLRLTPAQEATAGKSLTKLLRNRVAYHHSGLSYAARAGVVESLAKAGQLNVVVATMGLAAGINFSMRSVIVTDRRYFAGNFERQVEADELLQMFGRAGRRGLDEVGHALYTNDLPRLSDTKARQLRRATQVDWPSLISVMHAAKQRGEQPFAAAVELTHSLFSVQRVPLGVEHSLESGPRPCGLWVTDERARFVRRGMIEMLNSREEWEAKPAAESVTLGRAFVRENDRWRRALTVPRMLDGVGTGNLCRLREQNHYGRELPVATVLASGEVALVKWLKKAIGARCEPHGQLTSSHEKLSRRRAERPMKDLAARRGTCYP